MNNAEKKWIEIKFYMLLSSIYKKNFDLQDIFAFIEFVGSMFQCNIELTKRIAYNMLFKIRAKPQRKEIALWAYLNKVPIKKIIQYTGYKRQYIYELIKNQQIEEQCIYINWKDNEYECMQQLLDAFNKTKEWGL